MHRTVLEPPESTNVRSETLAALIVARVDEEAVIGLDALVQILPEYSWNQIFHTVDQLARTGRVVLRRHRYDYVLFSNVSGLTVSDLSRSNISGHRIAR